MRSFGHDRALNTSGHAGVGAGSLDAIVIGSGFGGSVSAARLAERGLRVLLLERGPWWGELGAASGAGRPYPRGLLGFRKAVRGVRWARGRMSRSLVLNRDGLLELHVFEQLIALTASGVGGGSLIYADVQIQPDDAFFDHFPPEISAEEMHPYYQRVRDTLEPSPLPERPARTAVFEQAVTSCGLPPARRPDLAVAWPAGHDLATAPSSSFLLGCEFPGKRSLDRTYVPLAVCHGAQVRSLSEVVALERSDTRYRVHWMDHAGRRRYWADVPLVVVAAGTLGTLRLLFAARDRDHSLELPAALGRRFSPGGDVMTFVYRSPDVGESRYGPCPGAVLVQEDGRHRFLIAEMGVPADAFPLPEVVRRRLRSSVVLSGMGRDASTGTISFDGGELRTATARSLDPELFHRIESTSGEIASRYRPRRVWVNPSGGPGGRRLLTVHPFGGAAIAQGPEEGVVNHTGEVFGNPGLYIADGSLFPRAPGLPPAMTIAALAERQATMIGESTAAAKARRARPRP